MKAVIIYRLIKPAMHCHRNTRLSVCIIYLAAAALFCGLWGAASLCSAAGTPAAPANYAGSESCRECHANFYQLWSTSKHGLAMQPYTPAFAKAKLTPQKSDVVIGKSRYRTDINAGVVFEAGPKGKKKYPMEHVLGGKNVYYFLTPLERGRLQTLPVAYDLNKKMVRHGRKRRAPLPGSRQRSAGELERRCLYV